jgi:hypothetical protein
MRRPVQYTGPRLECIRLRSEGYAKDTKEPAIPQGDSVRVRVRAGQNGFTTARITIRIIRAVGTSLIIR